jgi:hypothetical protein
MRKSELVEALKDYPDDATVWVICSDGKAFMPVNCISCEQTTMYYPREKPQHRAEIHIEARK